MGKSEILLQSAFIFIVASVLVLGGLVFSAKAAPFINLIPVPAQAAQEPQILSPLDESFQSPEVVAEKVAPVNIHFPSLDFTLPVAPATIYGDQWTLYDDKASWLTNSAEPGKGNVIIYAHNKKALFGGLTRLEIGDQVKLEHKSKWYTYTVMEKRKVLPTDVAAVVSNEDQLTLYTCNGSFDQKRLVVTARPLPAL